MEETKYTKKQVLDGLVAEFKKSNPKVSERLFHNLQYNTIDTALEITVNEIIVLTLDNILKHNPKDEYIHRSLLSHRLKKCIIKMFADQKDLEESSIKLSHISQTPLRKWIRVPGFGKECKEELKEYLTERDFFWDTSI